MHRLFWTCLVGAALAMACGGGTSDKRPNVLIILTDDQRYDAVADYMPETQARIVDQGVNFSTTFATTPLCCPSRASILTGMYAHTHGVTANESILDQPTFVQYLKIAGYHTGLVGKYLNSWDSTKSPRPEFDYWVATPGGGNEYLNAHLNVNGTKTTATRYITDELRDYALEFLKGADKRNQPFFLLFAPNAPHEPAIPALEDQQLYLDQPPYRPPSYNEADVLDKPNWLQSKPPLTGKEADLLDVLRLQQLQSLKSVDRAIAAMLDLLQGQGKLDNTVIFFLSDNGYLWGEHRLSGKIWAYEESARIPFAVRYPKLARAGRVEPRLVGNIDIAPTIYQLAGIPIPEGVEGRSLVPLLKGTDSWRKEILIEGYPYGNLYTAARTDRYVYVESDRDRSELYDLQRDPYELQNVVDDPAYADVVVHLQKRLQDLSPVHPRPLIGGS